MIKAIIHFAHWIDANRLLFPKQVEIYNVHAGIPNNPESFNVLNISNEPEPTRMSNQAVLNVASHYDLILTWDEDILKNCSNAKTFYCGMTWIMTEDIQHVIGNNKRFEATTFCTSKTLTSNHLTRHRLWNRQREIKNIPSVFWNSCHNPMPVINKNPSLGEYPRQKIQMFFAQYHIPIENTSVNNYFSEKLMDCFITETIPIYLGCPNIDKFFNKDGIITVNNEDEIIQACNSLDVGFYESKIQSIKENKELCQQYCRDFTDRIYDIIKECL
jgi:hypothetical protein